MIDRRETLRMVPKTCVFGLFEALWSRNHLSHGDFAPRSAANAFAGTPHMFDAFVDVQPVASDHNHAAERALGNGISAPGGHSRSTCSPAKTSRERCRKTLGAPPCQKCKCWSRWHRLSAFGG